VVFPGSIFRSIGEGRLTKEKIYFPCRARDWKIFFDPTFFTMGAFPGFGVHVLLVQKSLKKLNGAHFEPQVQRPTNTALWRGFSFSPILVDGRLIPAALPSF